MSTWIDGCRGILEAWYPGEQGAQAICEILFGEVCPSAKLPITFPKSVGQLPLYYSFKPSGRGYRYVENDGMPRYPFGYGLSYTTFSMENFTCRCEGDRATVSFTIENTGDYDGAQVAQVYLSGKNCDVVMPVLELKAYRRIKLSKGEKKTVAVEIPEEAFCYYNRKMVYGMHNGDYTLSVRTSASDVCASFEVQVRDQKVNSSV
jgi:beta-glucosidase